MMPATPILTLVGSVRAASAWCAERGLKRRDVLHILHPDQLLGVAGPINVTYLHDADESPKIRVIRERIKAINGRFRR